MTKKLSGNWFMEGSIDLEHKQYMLLAYLQYVNDHFTKTELYPHLSELVYQYRSLRVLMDNQEVLYEKFPRKLKGINWHKFKLAYQRVIEDDELMESIKTIIEWSLPKIHKQLEEGKEIHDFIEEQIHMSPVGIEPLDQTEGYMLIQNGEEKQTNVYRYELSFFEHSEEKYRSIKTTFLKAYTKNFINTLEAIKVDLTRTFTFLPNPAAYAVETTITLPMKPTLLPIARRMLARKLD